jgi:hypothetical protein
MELFPGTPSLKAPDGFTVGIPEGAMRVVPGGTHRSEHPRHRLL